MNNLLQQGDTEALDLAKQMEISLQAINLEKEAAELSTHLNYFLFDEARLTLASIAKSLNIRLSE